MDRGQICNALYTTCREKKQPRSKRTLIGKVSEETGEIIPTGKSGRRKTESEMTVPSDVNPISEQIELLGKKDEIIKELKAENAALRKEKAEILKSLQMLCQKISD